MGNSLCAGVRVDVAGSVGTTVRRASIGASELQYAQVLWAGDLGISSISLRCPGCPPCSYATCGPVTHSEVLQLCHPCGHGARAVPWKLNIRSISLHGQC